MPCDCSHLEPDAWERESKAIRDFLREVGLLKTEDDIYGNVKTIHEDTSLLCEWCKTHDVKEKSLELQIWWRDHLKADAKKEQGRLEEEKKMKLRKTALSKLTKEEREVLGV